jgi:alpha-ribazole phosphatase
MSEVFFIRHAETEMAGRFCGHSDPELNAEGLGQLPGLVETLSSETIDRVYSSDLLRAQTTARALAAGRGLPVELRCALREIDFGRWEGLRWEQVVAGDPDYSARWTAEFPGLPSPGGESFAAFESRVLREVTGLMEGNSRPIAVITHAGVLRVVLQHFLGCTEQDAWEQTKPYCCVFRCASGIQEVIGERR